MKKLKENIRNYRTLSLPDVVGLRVGIVLARLTHNCGTEPALARLNHNCGTEPVLARLNHNCETESARSTHNCETVVGW